MAYELRTTGAVTGIEGPLIFLDRVVQAGLGEAVEVEGADGNTRLGRVVSLDEESIIVELLEDTSGLGIEDVVVRFRGAPMMMALGPGLLGRVFDGVGRPRDGGAPIPAMVRRRVDTGTINPAERGLPQDFIETGVSSIDILNSLVRGQKLPIFSAGSRPRSPRPPGCAATTRALPWSSPASASAMTLPRAFAPRWSARARWNIPRCFSTSPPSPRPSGCSPRATPRPSRCWANP